MIDFKNVFQNVKFCSIEDLKTAFPPYIKEHTMYFVYEGYVSPDNCDASYGPTYTLTEYSTIEEVLKAKKEFENSLDKECQYAIFRVIEGVEKKLIAKEKVVEWELV